MPLTWLRRFARRHISPRPLGRRIVRTPRRSTALTLENLEDRALLSATMAQEVIPHNPLGSAANLTNVNGSLFFTVNDGATGTELWKTDGTAAGTVHLHDFLPGTGSGLTGPGSLTAVNGALYFAVNGTADAGLWKSDGTATGTDEVAPFKYLNDLTAFNGALYFSGVRTPGGAGLWKSDGTTTGTTQVQSVVIYSPLTAVNGSLLFAGADTAGAHGEELWKSDGTTAGTAMLKEIAPGQVSSSPYDFATANNLLFFDVANPLGQSGLWASDGTPGGTHRLQQAVPYSPADMTDVNGNLYFLNAGPTKPGVWKSDGTPTGTTPVTPINNGDDATVSMTSFQGKLFYLRQTNGLGSLWKTDGTATGTVQMPLPAGALSAGNLMTVNGSLFFTAHDVAGGMELWKSDGTATGTVMVDDVPNARGPAQLANVNGVLYFAVGNSQGIQVIKNDPASALTAVAGGPYSIYLGESVTLNGLSSTKTSTLTFAWTVNGHNVQGAAGLDDLSPSALTSYGITGPGNYPVWLTVTAGASSSTSEADLIVRSPLLNVIGFSNSASEGKAFNGALARFTDPAGTQTLSTYNAQVDWGDGTASSTATIASTPQGLVVSGSHIYAEEGNYTVNVSVAKGGGLPNMITTTMKVGDAPVWAGREFLRTTEGKAFTGTVATITDGTAQGKAGDFTATIQWGDGQTSAGTVAMTAPGKFAVQGGHTYSAAGTYTVTVTTADVGGSTSTAKSSFLVDDAMLTAVPQKVWSAVPPGSSSQLFVAGFTDSNPLATAGQYTATIDWGDGTTSPGSVSRPTGQPFFVVSGGHVFAKTGTYKITTTIQDPGGDKLTSTLTLQAVALNPGPPVVGTGTAKPG
jgi:ELWxxDGT repeat protein